MSSRRSGRGASRYDDEFDTARSKSRQPARASSGRRSGHSDAGELRHGTRNRGGKKNYVVDSSPDDDEEDDAEVESDQMDVDAEGEDDADAEGEEDAEGEDAEGDIDMDFSAPASKNSIKVSRPAPQPKPILKLGKSKVQASDDDDDDELSEADSDLEDQTMGMGDDTMADEDAEGEEIEVAGDGDEDDEEDEEEEDEEDVDAEGEDAEGETQMEDAEGEELDSEDDESRAMTPDFNKMTKRQRARFEDEPQEYMKLSDEVQVKKHFTAEELSMRRQEMARRRRNLSEKRNEEVKVRRYPFAPSLGFRNRLCIEFLLTESFFCRWKLSTSYSRNRPPKSAKKLLLREPKAKRTPAPKRLGFAGSTTRTEAKLPCPRKSSKDQAVLSLAAEKACHLARWLKRLPKVLSIKKSFWLFRAWIWSLKRVHVGHNESDNFSR